jgi:enterochelin esterase-like enzyme
VDSHYRTLTDRGHRSLGGLSRGGGWALQLGLQNPSLFGALGLHSPGIFVDFAPYIEYTIHKIPVDSRPQIWLDIGDADSELASVNIFEEILTRNSYIHKFHLYSGNHTEGYWSKHVTEYLQWYVQGWQAPAKQ